MNKSIFYLMLLVPLFQGFMWISTGCFGLSSRLSADVGPCGVNGIPYVALSLFIFAFYPWFLISTEKKPRKNKWAWLVAYAIASLGIACGVYYFFVRHDF
jgi:hypothetical protein